MSLVPKEISNGGLLGLASLLAAASAVPGRTVRRVLRRSGKGFTRLMPREIYPEQKMLPIPDTLRLCERCKVALIYKPFNSPPKCDKCGDTGREGELYVRVGSLQEAMKKANWTRERIGAVSTLVQALELTK